LTYLEWAQTTPLQSYSKRAKSDTTDLSLSMIKKTILTLASLLRKLLAQKNCLLELNQVNKSDFNQRATVKSNRKKLNDQLILSNIEFSLTFLVLAHAAMKVMNKIRNINYSRVLIAIQKCLLLV